MSDNVKHPRHYEGDGRKNIGMMLDEIEAGDWLKVDE